MKILYASGLSPKESSLYRLWALERLGHHVVPFNTFELSLPQGPNSALAANTNLCASKLAMPTEFTAQNGAVLTQSTPITVTGCVKKRLTSRQRLANALKQCRKNKNKAKRASCERHARKRSAVKRKAKAGKGGGGRKR